MRLRRTAVGAVVVAGLPVAAAVAGNAPAAADRFDCTSHLFFEGYGGKIVDIGCNAGAQGDQVICEGSLRIAGVPDDLAAEACRRAALP